MTLGPLWIVTLLYAGQAAIFVAQGKLALGLVLVGYSIANVGLIWGAANG
jgi:hypothetical protein